MNRKNLNVLRKLLAEECKKPIKIRDYKRIRELQLEIKNIKNASR